MKKSVVERMRHERGTAGCALSHPQDGFASDKLIAAAEGDLRGMRDRALIAVGDDTLLSPF